MPVSKIFTAMPAFGQVNTSFTTASLVATTRFLAERGIFGGFGQMSFPDLEDLRSMFLTIWFDKIDASHILFVDADMQFDPQLVLDMVDFDKELVGCLYPKRTLPISWVGSALPGPEQREQGFLKVEGIGFGVALVSRECVQRIIDGGCEIERNLDRSAAGQVLKSQGIDRMIRAFDKVRLADSTLSEDFSFCRRFLDVGGDVWAAIDHRVTHVGHYGFSGCYSDGKYPKFKLYEEANG